MGELVVDAPNILCARALADRVSGLRCRVEPAADESCVVRIAFGETDLGRLLCKVESWLTDYAIDAVQLLLDGRPYTLAAPAASFVRPRPLAELPDDLVLD